MAGVVLYTTMDVDHAFPVGDNLVCKWAILQEISLGIPEEVVKVSKLLSLMVWLVTILDVYQKVFV